MEPAPAIRHQPVLLNEVIHWLRPQPGQCIVDATLGGAGHGRRIAEILGPTGKLIGVEQDRSMLQQATSVLKQINTPLELIHCSFDELPELLADRGIAQVDGLLADLGFASDQMDDPSRGLAFQTEGPLDMRLNPEVGEPASELLAQLPEEDLANLIYKYGEERFSRRIARRILEFRQHTTLQTTRQLAELVRRCVPRSGKIDPATRTFQALRIAVNNELGKLEQLLAQLPIFLAAGGRAVIISFHSLEDRMVKHAFRNKECWHTLTKKPIEASLEETMANPRSRSAKLRAAERIAPEQL